MVREAPKGAMATVCWLVAAATVMSAPAGAHHSFAAFDAQKPITLNAVVSSFEWKNPHAWLQVTAPDQNGVSRDWGIELGAPAAMLREGWRPRSLAPGDKVAVTINPNRNGSYGGSLVKAVKADGVQLGGQTPK